MSVYVGINWHKLVFATDRQKLSLCQHFANLDWRDHRPLRVVLSEICGLQYSTKVFGA